MRTLTAFVLAVGALGVLVSALLAFGFPTSTSPGEDFAIASIMLFCVFAGLLASADSKTPKLALADSAFILANVVAFVAWFTLLILA